MDDTSDIQPDIEKSSRIPIYKQVKQYISQYIEQHPSADMIPSEVELSRSFKISRSTVRVAILELVNEGILERIPGKGTFVVPKGNQLVFTNWLTTEAYSKSALELLLDRFMAERQGVQIDNVGISYLQTEHQLMLMTSAGKAPDIASLIYLWIPIFAHQGALQPLDSLYTPKFRDIFYPQTLDAVTFRDHFYSINWVNAPNIMYFNRQILSDYCGDADCRAEHYDSLIELLVKIYEKSKGTVSPFSIPLLDDELFFLYSIYHFLHSFEGGVLNKDGEIIFNSEQNIKAFTWMRNLIKKGYVDVSRGHLENRSLFANNRVAFIIEGPWLLEIIPTLNSQYRGNMANIGFSTLPKGPTGVSWSVLWNHTLSIFKQCQNRDLALELIKYLALDPTASATYYQMTRMLPVRRDELENNPIYDDAFGRVLKKQMETAFPIPCADSPMFMVAITFCAKAAREILLGDMNIVSTLNACAELLKELYKR